MPIPNLDYEDHGSSETPPESSVYYSVHIPPDIQVEIDPYSNIFKDKQEALDLAKVHKKARFKVFAFYHEAVDFAISGKAHCETLHKSIGNLTKENTHQVNEKPTAFRGPKSQDLVKLRKAIENGSLKVVETKIWDNPRYLISSGDTPSILQEGSRYNALHVAAKCKNRDMCELILNTVSNINFVMLLYGDDDNQDFQERSKVLLDLYLNTPDKGLNETPLHFAVKFGAVDVVELLVSYPQCDRNVTNKFGKLPNQIVCERCDLGFTIKNKIAMLLADSFYVPVLRSDDNCTPPVIGEPFAPFSPPKFNEDPLQPQIEIHAYAGPMSKDAAERFRKVWKTPPRSLRQKLHCKDLEKGLENVGRSLAAKHEVGWKEYWSFLDDFVDIGSFEGLLALEKYLGSRVLLMCSNDSTNTNSSVGSNILSPISDLCKEFEACKLTENNHTKHRTSKRQVNSVFTRDQLLHSNIDPSLCIEKTCEVFAHRISNDILNVLESDYRKTYELLEADVLQLENVISSFMADNRFVNVDYRLVHHHLGYCIAARLKECLLTTDEIELMRHTLTVWLNTFTKESDYSSDEEYDNYRKDILKDYVKKKLNNKHVICVVHQILNVILDHSQDHSWNDGKPCDCVWVKVLPQKRGSNKFSRNYGVSEEENISRRLFGNDSDIDDFSFNENDCDINRHRKLNESDDDSDADSFATAVNSMDEINNSDSDDVFEDSFTSEEDIFIEGSVPTKMDYAVYNAVSCSKDKLNPIDYPNIYKWYHAVSLYTEIERQNWGTANLARCRVNSQSFGASTPTRPSKVDGTEIHHSPSSSWLHRIGIASPQHSLKVFKPNVSFNM